MRRALLLFWVTLASGCLNSGEPKTPPPAAVESTPVASPTVAATPAVPKPKSNPTPDLTWGKDFLSKANWLIQTPYGLIKIKFYTKAAPQSVNRVVELVNQGFYDGLIFHRVEEGFVIQSGDPTGNGTGGSGKKLKAEFSALHHNEGTVSLARTADPDSADSQFFITLGNFPHLDNQYTIIGSVVEGMSVAKKVQKSDKILWSVIE